MKIPVQDIPQADVLDDVVRVAEAVSQGVETYQEIAQFIGKVERQGAYYRRAAQILGLITFEENRATLEDRGRSLVNSQGTEREKFLRAAVLATPLFQRILFFFTRSTNWVYKQQLELFLTSITQDAGPSLMPRRVQTIVAWLERVGLILVEDEKYTLAPNALSKIENLEYPNLSEPLFPHSLDMKEYQAIESRAKQASKIINLMVDEAKTERAVVAHKHLVDILAEQIKRASHIPRYNKLIDLATEIQSQPYIFEMKSMQDSNKRGQVRRGLSQLYEYRYLQNVPSAKLILVIEGNLPTPMLWLQDYLEVDRNIYLICVENSELRATANTKSALSFLWR